MTKAPLKQADVVPAVKPAEARAVSEPPKSLRQRRPSNFRQQDVARAIKAAKGSGLEIVKVEVDPNTAKITLTVKNDDDTETTVNPFDTAPVQDPALRTRKTN
jgi:hypothetical protein